MLHICKKAKWMKNQTTKKEHADTDETKLRDTTNISSRSSMKLPRLWNLKRLINDLYCIALCLVAIYHKNVITYIQVC